MPAGVYLGGDELLGIRASWPAVESRLKPYSLGEVLDFLGRMSAVLFNAHDKDVQPGLLHGVLGDAASAAVQNLSRHRAEAAAAGGPFALVAFHQSGLLTALKLAARVIPIDAEAKGSPPRALGEALLMINNLLEDASIAPMGTDPDGVSGARHWAYFTFVNGVFYQRPHEVHELARAYELYCVDRPSLRSASGAYIDLPALVQQATGVKPSDLWAILFALLAHFRSIGSENAHEVRGAVERYRYFSGEYLFTREEIDSFFGLLAGDLAQVGAELAHGAPPTNFNEYDSMPLARTPLISHEDLVFAPFLPALFTGITSALHYRLLNQLGGGSEGNRFLTYMGDVFEHYVTELFRRAFEGSRTPRFVDSRALQQALRGVSPRGQEPSICDGLIIYEDAVILVETKAKLLKTAARAGADEDAFYAKFEEIVGEAAKQLDATIEHIRRGRLSSIGVAPAPITAYYPLLVTLERFPMSPFLYDQLERTVRSKGFLTGPGVKPLQLLEIGEAEYVEMSVREGQQLRQVLDVKLSQEGSRDSSYQNFAIQTGIGWPLARHNPYLAARFEELTQAAQRFFRTRSSAPPRTAG